MERVATFHRAISLGSMFLRRILSWRVALVTLALLSLGLGAVWAGQLSRERLRGIVSARDPSKPTFRHPAGPEFYFTRAVYNSYGRWQSWAVDYPKADRQFLIVIRNLIDIDAPDLENAVRLDDPKLRRFPFLYALEVGDILLSDAEVKGLREYLLAGGFLVIDDFWGTYEWQVFESQIVQVFPEYPIVDIPLDHPIFNQVYKIEEIIQVPNLPNAQWGRTWEQDGYYPAVKGIFDDEGRLMVVINWNTDLGDAWEWAERPEYPLRYSAFAVEMGINFIVYAMSH